VERHSAQKLHSSTIALLQIFDILFASNWVATCFRDVTYISYLLRTFYLSVTAEYLVNRMLCLAITKYMSNLLAIRAQVPLSNVEKQQLIIEDSTADLLLAFVASVLFQVITTL